MATSQRADYVIRWSGAPRPSTSPLHPSPNAWAPPPPIGELPLAAVLHSRLRARCPAESPLRPLISVHLPSSVRIVLSQLNEQETAQLWCNPIAARSPPHKLYSSVSRATGSRQFGHRSSAPLNWNRNPYQSHNQSSHTSHTLSIYIHRGGWLSWNPSNPPCYPLNTRNCNSCVTSCNIFH